MTQQEQKDWTGNVRWADDRQALLDDFAKAAMQLVIRNQRPSLGFSIQGDGFEILAKRCYDIAEAMMQERERRMKG